MLRAGASLPEVGQVLRHRRLLSTAIYANSRELHQMGEKPQVSWSALVLNWSRCPAAQAC
jgi:hypothetical protein